MSTFTLTLALTNDREIIQEFSKGNSEVAATAFVRKYQKFVFSTALRFLQNYDDADDAAQDAFIKAIGSISKFRSESSIKTWLYRITSNVCLSILRKRKFMNLFVSSDSDEFLSIPDNSTPDKKLEDSEFSDRFYKALSKLPEKQRETFALRYFEDLPYEEMSKMLGTSVGGLKANYFQAVKKLSNLLKTEIN